MNLLPKLTDSRGKESTTLFFVAVSWLALVVKFLVADMVLPVVGVMAPMSAGEFGMAVAGVLAIWLGREWTEKTMPPGGGDAH